MPKDGIDFGELSNMQLEAIAGGHPTAHRVWVDWTNTEHASDNKYLIADAIEATLGRDFDKCETFSEYLERRGLHEDETFTESGSYRKTIDGSTLVLGAAMKNAGRHEAARRFLARVRASMANMLLQYGNSLPRKVTDHGTPGVPLVLIGDGARSPLSGDPQGKTLAKPGPGMRSHVRAKDDAVPGGSKFDGPFEYTLGEEQRVMLAQLLGHPYNAKRYAYEDAVFRWARAHGVDHWGFTDAEVALARAFIANPRDVSLATQIAAIASECLPDQEIVHDRYEDGAIFSWMPELQASSTGNRAISGQYADGRIVHASADNGGRSKGDIRRQRTWEDAGAYYCQHLDGGKPLRVEKPGAPLAHRVRVHPRNGVSVQAAGAPAPSPAPTPAPGPTPAPAPAPGPTPAPAPPPIAIQLSVGGRPLSDQGREQVAAALKRPIPPGSYLVTANVEDAEIVPIWSGNGEPVRWVVTRKAAP